LAKHGAGKGGKAALAFFEMGHNVLALGAVADFGEQNFHLTTKVDAR